MLYSQLILSYLKHSLCSHLVSHAAVLKTISKYEGYHHPYCIASLLDFLDTHISGTTCRNKAEEGQLANAALSLLFWFTQIYSSILNDYTTNNEIDTEQQKILKSLVSLLDKLIQNKFLMSIIYVGKHEDADLINKIREKCNELVTASETAQFASTFHTQAFEDSLRKIINLDVDGIDNLLASIVPESNTYCLQPLISVEILLNPNNGTEKYVSKLHMIQRLKNYQPPRLYCELMRSCLSSLYNVNGLSNRESMWCAFTLIKVPQIISEMVIAANKGEFT